MIWFIILLLLCGGCKERADDGSTICLPYPCPSYKHEIGKLFPLLEILDEQIDWTSNIRWYSIKNKQTAEEFELFRNWEGKWTRRKKFDGKNWFQRYEVDNKWWREIRNEETGGWIRIYRD